MAFHMNGYNFTEGIRQILAMAREESARLHHEYVGTEHILLGLIRHGEGVGMNVLTRLGIDTQKVGRRIGEVIHPGRAPSHAGPDLPYTSRAKRVLELSTVEAKGLGHGYVGSEHLLLGLIAEEKGIAAQVLAHAGVTLEAAREEVRRILEGTDIGERVQHPNVVRTIEIGEASGELTQSGDASGLAGAKGRPIERVEVILHYRDGRRVQSSFTSPEDALGFLRFADKDDRPSID
jgi:ATP-dependent Clp protease ATP-binding subunit ClpA